MSKNMTPEQKEALMKVKQEQRKLVEEISKEFPGFSTSNLMGVKKRLIALKAAGANMYRIRWFGKTNEVKTVSGKLRKVKTMNAPAFNKFASILLANKEMLTWFNQVTHDPTWEEFWVTIERLAKRPKTLDTWSAAEWMVARNRYKNTVELVNQLSIKFLGQEMLDVKIREVEVTALFNKETYYFRYAMPQVAWDECKDINSRYFPEDHPSRFCVGDGHYQHQMKSGLYHGYIVDKTIDAKTNSYKDGEKFSFGFVLITSGGVCDWGFGPENRADGPEEQLAKAVFGTSETGGLDHGKPEEKWIRMILNNWFEMRRSTYNQWCGHIERMAGINGSNPNPELKDGFHERRDKNGEMFLEYASRGSIIGRVFLNPKGAKVTRYEHTWLANDNGFHCKPKEKSNRLFRWYMQPPDDENMRLIDAHKTAEDHARRGLGNKSKYLGTWEAKIAGGTLWKLANLNTLPWDWDLSRQAHNLDMFDREFTLPELSKLPESEFEIAYKEILKQEAVYSLRTKNAMTLKEIKRQVRKFNEIDNFFKVSCVELVYDHKKLSHCEKHNLHDSYWAGNVEEDLFVKLITLYDYKWWKTASGYMLVSPAVAYADPNRIITDAQAKAIDYKLAIMKGWAYFTRKYFSYGLPQSMADDVLIYDVPEDAARISRAYHEWLNEW